MHTSASFTQEEWEFIAVGSTNDLEDGQRLFVEIDDRMIVLFNVSGKIHAIEDMCSHDNNPLGDGELNRHEITCPRHGAVFDIRNGKVLSLPAVVDIPVYPVRVLEGEIFVGIPIL